MSNTQNIFYKATFKTILQNMDTITMFNQHKGKDILYFKESTPIPNPSKERVPKESFAPEHYLG